MSSSAVQDKNPSDRDHWRYTQIAFAVALAGILLMLAVPNNNNSNESGIAFREATNDALEGFSTETWGVSVGDYNGDYWPDIFVGNHRQRPSFYRNNADGTFSNVILQVDKDRAWLTNPRIDHHGAGFVDIDGDGDDDLLASTNGCCDAQFMISDGTYLEDRSGYNSGEWGLAGDGAGWSVTWLDYSGDNFMDLARLSFRQSDLKTRATGNENSYVNTGPDFACEQNNYAQLADINGDRKLEILCAREGTFPQKTYEFGNGVVTDYEASNPSLPAPTISHTLDTVIADFDGDLVNEVFAVRGSILPNQALAVSNTRVEGSIDASPNKKTGGIQFTATGPIEVTLNSRYNFINILRGVNSTSSYQQSGKMLTLDPNDTTNHGIPANMDGNRVYIGFDPATNVWTITQTGYGYWWYQYMVIETPSGTLSDVSLVNEREVDLPFRPALLDSGVSSWSNIAWEAGLREDILCAAAAGGDFDNDMDIDLYLVCRHGLENIENVLYENLGDGTFERISQAGGASGAIGKGLFSGAGTGENVVTLDYNNDGFLDLFVTNGLNTQPILQGGPHELFINEGNNNNWIELELRLAGSNHRATGATVLATAGGVTQLREENGGYHRWSQNHGRIHFGLADHTTVDLQVYWPSGTIESFSVNANALYEIVEGQGINPVTLGSVPQFDAPATGDECGTPLHVPSLDKALFIHKDCATNVWTMSVAAGGDRHRFEGAIEVGNGTVTSAVPTSFESADVLDTSDPSKLVFAMGVAGAGQDSVQFAFTGDSACLAMTSDNSVPVLLGSRHVPITGPIDLVTLESCQSDGPATISISNINADENSGTAVVNVTLSKPAPATITVKVSTVEGTAKKGTDFYGLFQELTFAPGETTKSVSVSLVDDLDAEDNETFSVRLFAAQGAQIANSPAQVTITDNDSSGATPTLSVQTTSVSEGAGSAAIALELSQPSTQTVSVNVATQEGSAAAGSDFYGNFSTITFAAGETSKVFNVSIVDDAETEDDEVFNVRLFNESGALIAAESNPITIKDNDNAGTISVSLTPVTVSESAATADVVVTLSSPASDVVSVNFATRAGTATKGSDFYGKFQALEFAPGEISKTVSITIIDDSVAEPTESLTTRLFGASGVVISSTEAAITILDDD